jgi:hypothetical protein
MYGRLTLCPDQAFLLPQRLAQKPAHAAVRPAPLVLEHGTKAPGEAAGIDEGVEIEFHRDGSPGGQRLAARFRDSPHVDCDNPESAERMFARLSSQAEAACV